MAKAGRKTFAVGIDYGTNSVRTLIVDTADGSEIATSVYDYPSGDAGILLDPKDPNLARQNPADYVEGFYRSVRGALRAAKKEPGFQAENVVGIGVDTTGSTPIPVDRQGTPLAREPRFTNSLAAHAWLWKDHTGHAEAAEITEEARKQRTPYLAKCGGTYSSEWYWSKILHCRRSEPQVFEAAYAWVELADFIPAFLTGHLDPNTLPRCICAAGHKAMYNDQWGGLPSKEFLTRLDPALGPLRDRYAPKAIPADQQAGGLRAEIARKVGLRAGLPVAVGAFDAHTGAVGAGIKPGRLVKIIGTSTCDMMVVPFDQHLPDVPGLCGIVPGSIIPGMFGLEAGQSAVGDIFNWFAGHLAPAKYTSHGDPHVNLTREAEQLKPGQSGLLALDWNNGNRTILVDPLLTGMLLGQTLHTTAAEIYRALVEATAFGALVIIQRFEEYGVPVDEVINCGGIAEKNPFVMQIYADVSGRPMKISRSAQTCALGAAIFGAVVGGAYRSTEQAVQRMTGVKGKVYRPRKAAAAVYAELYRLYRTLHDAFGTAGYRGKLYHVMKELIAIRDRVRKG
ncbi:MAG: ribulokinase [Planctomycetes bacterium RBG_16_64_12]|nr:MAG: ribulokinase [Planctomycetes bacterium RBG_16_64_12]